MKDTKILGFMGAGFLAALLVILGMNLRGQEPPEVQTRLVSVDASKCLITWEHQGRKYRISLDDRTMQVDKEPGRKFSQAEAQNVHYLVFLWNKYALESEIWWAEGKGEKEDSVVARRFEF